MANKKKNARIAVVTGGTRGIGAAISMALDKAGYLVAANYARNDEAASAFSEETGITAFKWDVSDFDACAKGMAKVEKTLGAHVEVLVNNAGITRDCMTHKMTLEDWQSVMTTNLDSCFNNTRAVLNGMRDSGFGRIVNISSVNGQAGQLGQSNYSAAKAGMSGFTKSLALEVARKGITVNVVSPGYVETEMVRGVPPEVLKSIISQVPVQRLGKPEEVARCVLFLTDDNAGFITGETICVNGGYYME